MQQEKIFEPGQMTYRVNSAPFKLRRKELHFSLRTCAVALSSHCGVLITAMKLHRCEKQKFFIVDGEMYAAIKKVLRV